NLYSRVCSLLDIDHMADSSPEEKLKKTTEKNNERLEFDTSMLMRSVGNNPDFFNHMLHTFITNANQTRQDFIAALAAEDWEKAGEKAHKAIPSFKYFGLAATVDELMQLEDVTLRRPDNSKANELTGKLINDIELIVHSAEKSRLPEKK
ncbi:MAG: Hpt domain-containing protein, partial [bacterium]